MTKKKQFKKEPTSCFRVFLDCFFLFKNLQQKKNKKLVNNKIVKNKKQRKTEKTQKRKHKKSTTKKSVIKTKKRDIHGYKKKYNI